MTPAAKGRAPVLIPLRTVPGMNVREHHMARARRVKQERLLTAFGLLGVEKPALPCTVWLTRIGPSNGLDDDNLAGALKGVRDEVAYWLVVDDRRSDVVRYRYAQRRGREWGVEVGFGPPETTLFAQNAHPSANTVAQEAQP